MEIPLVPFPTTLGMDCSTPNDTEIGDQKLVQDPNDTTKRAIAAAFFGDTTREDPLANNQLREYFDYYNRELRRLRAGIPSAISKLAAKTHHDLLHIARTISQNRDLSRSDIRQQLLIHFSTSDLQTVDRSMDLTLRLWLHINVRDTTLSVRQPEQPSVQWDDDSSITTFVKQQFRPSTVLLTYREARLDPDFTATRMVHMCKLDVRWTESIDSHLRLDARNGKRILWVFPYKSWLVRRINTTTSDEQGVKQPKLLPTALLRETITTLNLLFPQSDPATDALLREHGQSFASQPPFDGPQRPSLDEFSFWKGRLLDLHEEVYKATPNTWTQLWRDRRSPQQWWQFWFVILGLIIAPFTVISGVTAVLQLLKP